MVESFGFSYTTKFTWFDLGLRNSMTLLQDMNFSKFSWNEISDNQLSKDSEDALEFCGQCLMSRPNDKGNIHFFPGTNLYPSMELPLHQHVQNN